MFGIQVNTLDSKDQFARELILARGVSLGGNSAEARRSDAGSNATKLRPIESVVRLRFEL